MNGSLGFVPGLSWIPLPKKVAESNGKSHEQTLLARKMFEFLGQDAPQFILQVKLNIPSTLNIEWHPELIVDAIKC